MNILRHLCPLLRGEKGMLAEKDGNKFTVYLTGMFTGTMLSIQNYNITCHKIFVSIPKDLLRQRRFKSDRERERKRVRGSENFHLSLNEQI